MGLEVGQTLECPSQTPSTQFVPLSCYLPRPSALLDALPPSSALHQTQTCRSHRPRLKPRPFTASCHQLPRPYQVPGVSCLTLSFSGSPSC